MAALCREFGKLTLRACCREFGKLTLTDTLGFWLSFLWRKADFKRKARVLRQGSFIGPRAEALCKSSVSQVPRSHSKGYFPKAVGS